MAFNVWTPNLTMKANMVQTFTVASSTNGQTFNVSIKHPSGSPTSGSVTIATHTASGDTTASIASSLATQLQASQHEWAKRVTWSYPGSGSVITATANYAGEPFVVQTSGTGTINTSTTQQNRGPNDWNVPGNWSAGTVPASDDIVLLRGNTSILYGLNQSSVTLDSLSVESMRAQIGWPGYPLAIGNDGIMTVDSNGLDMHFLPSANLSVLNVINVGSFYPYGTAGTISVMRALSGVVNIVDEFACTTLFVAGADVSATGDRLAIGTVNVSSGEFLLAVNSFALAAINVDGGRAILVGPLAAVTITQSGGNVIYNAGGVTTYNLYSGTCDCTQSRTARTIATMNHHQAARLLIDRSVVTITTYNTFGTMQIMGA